MNANADNGSLRRLALLFLAFVFALMMSSASAVAQDKPSRANSDMTGEIKSESSDNLIYLVRHFEKQISGNEAGYSKDPELTLQGISKAKSLSNFMADRNIIAIYSSEYKRTQQSVKPSAEKLNLVVKSYDPSNLPAFAEQLQAWSLKNQGNILVVGHSNTTPELLNLLGGPQIHMTEEDYGDLFSLKLTKNKAQAASSFKQTLIK
jgi:broad specificity phosphatase PhoE